MEIAASKVSLPKKKKKGGGMRFHLLALPALLLFACVTCPCLPQLFHWHKTFMRLTLLKPKTIFWSLLTLPLAALAGGLLVVPTVAVLIAVAPGGRRGMFQHFTDSELDVTASVVWSFLIGVGSVAFSIFVSDALTAVLTPALVLAGLAVLILGSCEAETMLLPVRAAARMAPVRPNVSNGIAVFSLLLEFFQLGLLAIRAVALDMQLVGVSVHASFFFALSDFFVIPSASVEIVSVSFYVSVGLAGVLFGFLAIAVVLTSQPEKRVGRVTEQQEREGNLGWLKQILTTISDTLFITLCSGCLLGVSSLPSGVAGSLTLGNAVARASFFAFILGSLLIMLPLQAVFPDIWRPSGLDVYASPLFSLVEKVLKSVLITVIGVVRVPYVQTGLAAAVLLSLLLTTLGMETLVGKTGRPGVMTRPWASEARMTSFIMALGCVPLSFVPQVAADAVLGSWMGFCLLWFGAGQAVRHELRRRRAVQARREVEEQCREAMRCLHVAAVSAVQHGTASEHGRRILRQTRSGDRLL